METPTNAGMISQSSIRNLALCVTRAQKRMMTATIHRADSAALAAMMDEGDGVATAMANNYVTMWLRVDEPVDLVSH